MVTAGIIGINVAMLTIFKKEIKIKEFLKNKKIMLWLLLVVILFIFQNSLKYEIEVLQENIIIKKIDSFFKDSKTLEIYLGLVSFLLAIYIYCIGIGNTFKKYIIIYLIGEGTILYLSLMVLFMYFLGISNIYIISLLLLTFYELYKIIDLIFFISSQNRFSNEFDKIIYKFKETDSERGLKDLYYEIKKNIFLSLKDEDYIGFNEGLEFYVKLLKSDFLEPINFQKIDTSIKEKIRNVLQEQEPQSDENSVIFTKIEITAIKDVEEKEQEESIVFVYLMYKYLLKNI